MEYCYIAPKDNELYHYGIKGMHWGIRRYQPYKTVPRKSGKGGVYKPTTKAGKAKLWKTREAERQAGRYDRKEKVIQSYIDKKTKKLSEAKKNGASDKKIDKLERKIDYGQTEKRINEKLKKAELNKIKKMSIDDVSDARLKKGAWYTGQVLKSTAVKTATLAAIGGAIGAFDKSAALTAKGNAYQQKAWTQKFAAQEYDRLSNEAFDTAHKNLGNFNNGAFNKARSNMGEYAEKAIDAMSKNAQFQHVANGARAASLALKTAGFGLSATAAGGVVANTTKFAKVNEYSNLSRKEKKQIIDPERQAYNKRSDASKIAKVSQGLARTGARVGSRIYRGTTLGDYYSRYVDKSVNRDKKKKR